jgi:hypothetical protein
MLIQSPFDDTSSGIETAPMRAKSLWYSRRSRGSSSPPCGRADADHPSLRGPSMVAVSVCRVDIAEAEAIIATPVTGHT